MGLNPKVGSGRSTGLKFLSDIVKQVRKIACCLSKGSQYLETVQDRCVSSNGVMHMKSMQLGWPKTEMHEEPLPPEIEGSFKVVSCVSKKNTEMTGTIRVFSRFDVISSQTQLWRCL